MLVEEVLNTQEVLDPWSFEFQNSVNSNSNSSEFFRIILCNVRVRDWGSKLAPNVCPMLST
jgi:hypothetical protein